MFIYCTLLLLENLDNAINYSRYRGSHVKAINIYCIHDIRFFRIAKHIIFNYIPKCNFHVGSQSRAFILYRFLLEDIAAGKRERAEFRARSYERFVHFWKFVRAFAAINLYIAPAFGNFYDL